MAKLFEETTGMLLSVCESLQNCKDTLVTCQNELEAANSKIQSWHSTLKNEPSVPTGVTPDPKILITHLQTLKRSEEYLREQEKKREAEFIVRLAKLEQEITELKSAVWDLELQFKASYTEIHEEGYLRIQPIKDFTADSTRESNY